MLRPKGTPPTKGVPRATFAKWTPISGGAGAFTGGPLKVVHHKTQGDTAEGALRAYKTNRSDPHFTVGPNGVLQHIDTAEAARSLRNAEGGVQTNRDGALQIEVVGWSGTTCAPSTLENLVTLLVWIEQRHGVPWLWPEGRPPLTSASYGLNNGERHSSLWDATGGHYGHSQVPENTHWDPAYTDWEWQWLNDSMRPKPAPPITYPSVKEGPPLEVEVQIVPVSVQLGKTDADGNANTWVPYPKASIVGYLPQGRRPNVDGGYKTPDVAFAEEGDGTVVSVEEWFPLTEVSVDIRVAR